MTIVYKITNKWNDYFYIGSSKLSPSKTLRTLTMKAHRFSLKEGGKLFCFGQNYKRKSLVELLIFGCEREMTQMTDFSKYSGKDLFDIEVLAEDWGSAGLNCIIEYSKKTMTRIKNEFIRKEKDNPYLLNERIPLTEEERREYNSLSKKNKCNLTYANKLNNWNKFNTICALCNLDFKMEKPLPKNYKTQTQDWLKKIPKFLINEAYSVLGDDFNDNELTSYLKKRYKEIVLETTIM